MRPELPQLKARQSTRDPRGAVREEKAGTIWRAKSAERPGHGQRRNEVGHAGHDESPIDVSHLPSTSSLEILVVFSSISTADPDGPLNIHQVLADLAASRVRTSIISLSGEIKICRQLCERTGGRFGVAMDEDHLRELLWDTIPPPAQTIAAPATIGVRNALAAGGQHPGQAGRPPPAGDLMVMGFPIRLPMGGETLCVCHGLLKRGGYLCPRCGSKLCDVPTDCEVCNLMVVSSPHLARRSVPSRIRSHELTFEFLVSLSRGNVCDAGHPSALAGG